MNPGTSSDIYMLGHCYKGLPGRFQWDSTLQWEARTPPKAVGSNARFQRNSTSLRLRRPGLSRTYLHMAKWAPRGWICAGKARHYHTLATNVSGSVSFSLASILLRPWPDTLEYAAWYLATPGSKKATSPVWREVCSTPGMWRSDQRGLDLKPAEW